MLIEFSIPLKLDWAMYNLCCMLTSLKAIYILRNLTDFYKIIDKDNIEITKVFIMQGKKLNKHPSCWRYSDNYQKICSIHCKFVSLFHYNKM